MSLIHEQTLARKVEEEVVLIMEEEKTRGVERNLTRICKPVQMN
jgi:hypothetical protein